MFGINGWEFIILAIIALVVIGPDKLPKFVSDASKMARQVRRMARDAQNEVRDQLGPEFADIDVRDLNPRKFVSKHLLDDSLDDIDVNLGLDDDDDEPRRRPGRSASSTPAPATAPVNGSSSGSGIDFSKNDRPAYDDDAT
ncbi:sec-independent translocase [Motilibacter deserti]|uniref:Sec-independent protein translocase subunit TatB n=1 Tax=Motilibacter deserti TaxID=2714956 RepID=A0ABX0GQS6_9ACTN|nr:sec-independent translocase [Motilibacter deserti]NHC13196.1 Sec-independent protein translocase subunit TatB [Motilibacter deserti]